MNNSKIYRFEAEITDVGQRLDNFIVQRSEVTGADILSREFAQKLIERSDVLVNEKTVKKSAFKIKSGMTIKIRIAEAEDLSLTPKKIPLEIIYEDKDILVINKQSNLSVHPAEHQTEASADNLVQGLLYHLKGKLSGIGGVKRPGIVHRLDKDTSGMLIVAKNDRAHLKLAEDFKNRKITKLYQALVVGHLKNPEGRLVSEIGRSRSDRKKMTVGGIKARKAITEYRVLDEYMIKTLPIGQRTFSLVEIRLLTGRTHQIRVHFKELGHPLVGDAVYGNDKINRWFSNKLELKRQFLHAYYLKFNHPVTGKAIELGVGFPIELQHVLAKMSRSQEQ